MLEGTYNAAFLPPTGFEEQRPAYFTWVAESVCNDNSCVATATLLNPTVGQRLPDNMEFDYGDGHWLSVNEQPGVCDRGDAGTFDGSEWFIISLEPHPDGTMSGSYRNVMSIGGCQVEQPVRLTRAAQPQSASELADPAMLEPRAVSPAVGLRGTYTRTQTLPDSDQEFEPTTFTGDTLCLRTGTKCLTFMRTADKSGVMVMVFADGRWTETLVPSDITCGDATGTMTSRIEYPLLAPTPDPIAVQTGNLRQTYSDGCTGHRDYQLTLERTEG